MLYALQRCSILSDIYFNSLNLFLGLPFLFYLILICNYFDHFLCHLDLFQLRLERAKALSNSSSSVTPLYLFVLNYQDQRFCLTLLFLYLRLMGYLQCHNYIFLLFQLLCLLGFEQLLTFISHLKHFFNLFESPYFLSSSPLFNPLMKI